MQFQRLIFVATAGILLMVSNLSTVEGLECWVCSSMVNADCDETFSGEVSDTILKRDCREVPSPYGSPRKVPATTCITSIIRVNNKTIVSRGCASPGDIGIVEPASPECRMVSVTTTRGTVSSETCLCAGDYCNGAEIKKFGAILGLLLPFGFFCSWIMATPF